MDPKRAEKELQGMRTAIRRMQTTLGDLLADDDTSNLRGRIAVLEARKQTLGTAFTIADQSTLNELIATLDEKSGGKAALNSRAVVQQMVVTPEIVDGMNAAIKVVKPQLQPLLALGGVELNQAQLFDLFESVCDLDPEKSDTPANNDDEASKDGDTDDASTGGSSSDAGPAPSKRVKRLVEQIANAHILTAKDIKTELSREALYTADNFRVKHSSRDSITKVVLFFLLGAAVFMPSESRPCDLEAPLAAYSNASEAQCGWTIIDTFYFSICMLTIDQQPFFEPTWWLTQAFLVPYFSIGILYIWPILRKLCGELPRLIRKIWYHASHYLSGGRSKWLLRKFHEKVTKRLHKIFFRHLDTFFDMLFMLEYTRRYRWQEKVQRCQDLLSNAKEHLRRQVEELKEELCSEEKIEKLLVDYAREIPVTAAIQRLVVVKALRSTGLDKGKYGLQYEDVAPLFGEPLRPRRRVHLATRAHTPWTRPLVSYPCILVSAC